MGRQQNDSLADGCVLVGPESPARMLKKKKSKFPHRPSRIGQEYQAALPLWVQPVQPRGNGCATDVDDPRKVDEVGMVICPGTLNCYTIMTHHADTHTHHHCRCRPATTRLQLPKTANSPTSSASIKIEYRSNENRVCLLDRIAHGRQAAMPCAMKQGSGPG